MPVRELGHHSCVQPEVTSLCLLRAGFVTKRKRIFNKENLIQTLDGSVSFPMQLVPQFAFDIQTLLDFSFPWSSPGAKKWGEK